MSSRLIFGASSMDAITEAGTLRPVIAIRSRKLIVSCADYSLQVGLYLELALLLWGGSPSTFALARERKMIDMTHRTRERSRISDGQRRSKR